jgi:hypothetical protein
MRILMSLVFFVLFLVLLAGCGARYKYDGVSFSSSSELLTRQNEINSNALNKITPTNNPVHGTALILLPSDVEIHKNYIKVVGYNGGLEKEQIDCLITSINKYYQYMADAIQKRGLFDSVSIERHNGNPASHPVGNYDYMVFVDVDGMFVRDKNNPRPLFVVVEKNVSGDASRTLSFLDSLYQQAISLRSK